jgi:hypothetical protein
MDLLHHTAEAAEEEAKRALGRGDYNMALPAI